MLKTVMTMAVAALTIASFGNSASAQDQVNVRFSWKLKGEYAPLYLADEKGFFANKNVKVRLGEGAGAPAALGALLQGQEDVVILPGIFAISAIQKGMPVKLIAVWHPRTPVTIISHPDKPVLKPKDMEGKSIAVSVGETGTTYLDTFCQINHVDCSKIKRVQVDAASRVNYFLQGQVDMVSVYQTNDLPALEEKVGKAFPKLDMAANGLAVPGLSAVSSDTDINKRADVLKRFLAAVDEGIAATRQDPKLAAEVLLKHWPAGPSLNVVEQQVRATVDAIKPENGHPAGWIDPKLITSSLDLLKTESDIGKPRPVDVFYTNTLLPNAPVKTQ
ncbi:MAG TPA: ABC transporter substrate-binding protein [Sphingomicrobium sp.]|nr:ABC transporter substrate-binding protein [Sphingomicrobium sp.]